MVHFPALSSTAYVFNRGYSGITLSGFPHSDISGSNACLQLTEAYRSLPRLHRLLAPRHPPYALSSLTTLGKLTNSGYRRRSSPNAGRPTPLSRPSGFPEPRQHPLSTTSLRKATVCRIFSCQIPAGTRCPQTIDRTDRPANDRRDPRAANAGGEYRARTGDLLVANQALSPAELIPQPLSRSKNTAPTGSPNSPQSPSPLQRHSTAARSGGPG